MKKRIVVLLAVAVSLSLTACSGDNSSATSTTEATTSNNSIATTTPTTSTNSLTTTTPISTDTSTIPTTSSTQEETEPTLLTASPDLPTKWTSYQFELKGKIYSLPVRYSEFVANGWAPKNDKELADTLKPNQYIISNITLYNGENEINVQFANLDSKALPASECYVSSVMIMSLNKGNTLILPGNITLGSPMDTVQTLYGEPSKKNESKSSIEWKYQKKIYDDVIVTFDPTTKKVTKLKMSNQYLTK